MEVWNIPTLTLPVSTDVMPRLSKLSKEKAGPAGQLPRVPTNRGAKTSLE